MILANHSRPFPSGLLPLYQNESLCDSNENQFRVQVHFRVNQILI